MKRVKCAAKVTEVVIELPGGEEWVFAMDMAAMANMVEGGRDISELMEEYRSRHWPKFCILASRTGSRRSRWTRCAKRSSPAAR